jgi:ligand-binding sensor protein
MRDYRLEVAFCMSHDVKNEIMEKAQKDSSSDVLKFMVNTFARKGVDVYYENEHGIYIHFNSIEWYSNRGCPAAVLIEDVVISRENESRFIRIGEDLDDIEMFGNFDKVKRLDVSRWIQVTDLSDDC